ncbi:translation initiation factor IF-2 [Candidatus Daviesbacteria bacterium]|nr:translation initiation factor IF-2 [Candidatus Daviesbacteria bacterium]
MTEVTRPPIVTILGHVDHGKTTLLDFIRKTNVASREHGGITQHIGAYQISAQGTGDSGQKDKNSLKPATSNLITFIDTPGHAAFEKMRSRGAKVADIAVLVVAADDGIMPQTDEAIKHIQEAKVPMIVAVNKIDMSGIDVKVQLEKIKKQLSDRKILVEEYGGDTPVVPISAKSGEGIPKLLEMITLVSELNDIKGDPQEVASGVVIESSLDKFKGPIATILVRDGTLRKGDQIMVGGSKGKVRGMFDFNGKSLEAAGPSTPVEVLGLEGVPAVGGLLGKESPSKALAEADKEVKSLVDKLRQGAPKTLKLVIKADKQGSLEAIQSSLEKFNEEGEVVNFIFSGTGDIGEENIKLAAAVGAIVLGFNVKIAPNAQKLAEAEKVLIRTYNIIYELIEEMEEVVEALLKVGQVEEVFGRANIIAEFPFGKGERIAGCRIIEGEIAKGRKIRIVRESAVIGETKLKSLRKVKEEVQKAEKGNDCGMLFDPPVNFQVSDVVESFRVI